MMAGEMGDFTFYGNADECVEEEQATCMDDENIAAIAETCWYSATYNVCDDTETCTAIVTVDGTDYIAACDDLEDYFLDGEEYEGEDNTEENTEETTEENTEETTEENTEEATEETTEENTEEATEETADDTEMIVAFGLRGSGTA